MRAVRAVGLGKLHSPREVAGFAVTTAGHKTADAPESMAERETGRQRIEGRPKRHFCFPREQPDRQRGAKERPVKHHAGALHKQIL